MDDQSAPHVDFRSDNTGRVAPELLAALAAANEGTALGYGGDAWTEAVQDRFSELFETRVTVYPVSTGTAANALSLAALSPSYGAIYCAELAHVTNSEANAAGFFSGGAKLSLLPGPHGKLTAEALEAALAVAGAGLMHRSQPAAVTLTQASDRGAVYTLDEIRAVTRVAKAHGLRTHMDGARFANALARLGCSPADLTWRSGIDVLSFGVTKNGGLLCDAIVVFSPDAVTALPNQLRRAGQVWSKMRFAAAQLLAYVEDGLWLRLAHKANAVAAHIEAGLRNLPGATVLAPVEANEIFVKLPPRALDGLERDGIRFYRYPGSVARLVCRFDATPAEADAVLASLRRHLTGA
ncbi:MAG: low specificity L-threonine aldolase [Alphaproteobacteria bacterium]|nr:low specificity L-threonine aldolase [Alphaproteobacteria bacterium]